MAEQPRKLQAALELAEQGFHVFPIEPNTKVPAIDSWQHKACRDPAQIKRWWTDPVMDIELDRNIGIYTGRYGDDQALLVVDVDIKDDRNGYESMKQYDMAPSLVSLTPSGGQHIIYVVDEPVKQGANVLGPGLDIRSYGGYIVAPGSEINGKFYRWAQ